MNTTAETLAAIRAAARAADYIEIRGSSPEAEDTHIIFGDAEMADDFLHGPGVLGKAIDVHINSRGEVERATLRIDTAIIEDVRVEHGTTDQRLIRAVALFTDYPAREDRQ